MPLTNKVLNTFRCDLKKEDGSPACHVEFEYDPNVKPPQTWPQGVQIALTKVVAVVHPLSNCTTFYCSDAHAVEAIGLGQHLPPMPPKIVLATTEAEVKVAAAGSKAVAEMKGPRVKAR